MANRASRIGKLRGVRAVKGRVSEPDIVCDSFTVAAAEAAQGVGVQSEAARRGGTTVKYITSLDTTFYEWTSERGVRHCVTVPGAMAGRWHTSQAIKQAEFNGARHQSGTQEGMNNA